MDDAVDAVAVDLEGPGAQPIRRAAPPRLPLARGGPVDRSQQQIGLVADIAGLDPDVGEIGTLSRGQQRLCL